MLTIMENRKRPRFEMINIDNNYSNASMQGVASTTTATLATIGGQSYILNNSTTSSLPANIFLSICEDDDNSNDSEEYILDHSLLTPIKLEHPIETETITNQNLRQQEKTLVTTVPQYRIINQAGKPLNSALLNSSSSTINSATLNANNPLISNSVHIPPGCDIYVVKEVFDLPKQIIAESTNNNNTITDCKALTNDTTTTIKLKPTTSSLPLPCQTFNNTKSLNSNSTIPINATSNISTCSTSITTFAEERAKRSLILESYKKRDDKRRATHNEVERRRRDKINSLIFNLKEMLPSEATPSSINQNTSANHLSVPQQGTASTATRTPSSDSKSQILIRACEYIKSMKEEINSLQECLTENENLRLKNQRLQDEVNQLRSKQQQKLRNNNNILLRTNTTLNSNNSNHNSNNSDSCEITLNSLNTTYGNVQLFSPSSNHEHNNHQDLVDLVGLTTSSNATASAPITRSYAKRQLIITDYVD